MMRLLFWLLLISCTAVAAPPPNVIVILADDMAVGDIAAFNQGITHTPTLDRLIREDQASVHVRTSPDRWFGVTYPEDKPVVAAGISNLVNDGVYLQCLWN